MAKIYVVTRYRGEWDSFEEHVVEVFAIRFKAENYIKTKESDNAKLVQIWEKVQIEIDRWAENSPDPLLGFTDRWAENSPDPLLGFIGWYELQNRETERLLDLHCLTSEEKKEILDNQFYLKVGFVIEEFDLID